MSEQGREKKSEKQKIFNVLSLLTFPPGQLLNGQLEGGYFNEARIRQIMLTERVKVCCSSPINFHCVVREKIKAAKPLIEKLNFLGDLCVDNN